MLKYFHAEDMDVAEGEVERQTWRVTNTVQYDEAKGKVRTTPWIKPRVLAWAASALPLNYGHQTTISLHNPPYVCMNFTHSELVWPKAELGEPVHGLIYIRFT